MSPDITSDFIMQMESSCPIEPVLVRAHYSATQPFEMEMDFRLSDGSGAVWAFARDLFMGRSSTCPGGGSVEVWREGRGADRRVFIGLIGPTGACLLSARAKDIDRWCRKMKKLVPIGSEHYFFDIETELRALLQ